MFISPAYAQTGGGSGGFDLVALMPLVLIFVVFYFLIIRPQQKKVKEHKVMVEALRRGDRVVTTGGILGTVVKVDGEREFTLEIAPGVRRDGAASGRAEGPCVGGGAGIPRAA